MLAGHTRNVVSIADWLSCLGHEVEFWERSDEYYVEEFESPIFGKFTVRTTTNKKDVRFQMKDIDKYYDIYCKDNLRFILKTFPTATQMGLELKFPENLANEMKEKGFITSTEIFSALPEGLRMHGTLFINYPNFPIKPFKKMFTNSYFTRRRTYEKYGILPEVFYPPVRDDFNPHEKKDFDFIIYSRLEPAKMQGIHEFLKVHAGKRILIMGMDQGLDLSGYNVTVIKNATRAQIKEYLQRAKNYVHFYTFKDDGKVYGEHFGQAIVEALYAGAQPWVPDVPSGALEIPCVERYRSFDEIIVRNGVSDDCIALATLKFDPRFRFNEVEKLLP